MATKAEKQAQRDLTVTLYLMRSLYAMLKDRDDDPSRRICGMINAWITENC